MSSRGDTLDHDGYAHVLEPIWTYLARTDDPLKSDVIFVFGSLDLEVPRRAAELYTAGFAPRVLVSGHRSGRGRRPDAFDLGCLSPDETTSPSIMAEVLPRSLESLDGKVAGFGVMLDAHQGPPNVTTSKVLDKPEALVFKDELVTLGVPNSAITTEVRAGNTLENVQFGMSALRSVGQTPHSVLLVAKGFAMRRCVATFARQYPEVHVLSCPPLGSLATQRDRPLAMFVVRLLSELRRLDEYGAAGDIEPQVIPASVREAARRANSLVPSLMR